jgi:ankyrin repeat protein
MAEIVNNNGEIEALPADLQFLREASTNGIIGWFAQNKWYENAQHMFPKVWHLLEKRIREQPLQARDVDDDGRLLIHDILWLSSANRNETAAAPLSLIQLLIELHPDGLHFQDGEGRVPLYWAVSHPCVDCFRAVLYNGSVEVTTIQDRNGWTPLHRSTSQKVSLAMLWELLCFNRDCISIQDHDGMTALELLEENYQYGQDAKSVLLKLVKNYNHIPKLPSDDVTALIESHPACTVLSPRLEPDNDAFILHQALKAKCPFTLVDALVQVFPNQVQHADIDGQLPLHIALQSNLGASVRLLASKFPAALYIADPINGLLPIEQAILNAGKDGSLENIDAVDALLRANPAFLE